MRREFVTNYLNIEVNGFNCSVRYIVTAMYYIIDSDGFATTEQKTIEDIILSKKEIEEEGGHDKIIEQLKENYSPLIIN